MYDLENIKNLIVYRDIAVSNKNKKDFCECYSPLLALKLLKYYFSSSSLNTLIKEYITEDIERNIIVLYVTEKFTQKDELGNASIHIKLTLRKIGRKNLFDGWIIIDSELGKFNKIKDTLTN